MKQKIFTFLLIAATGLTACKKLGNQPDIKEYDEQEIQAYLSNNNITGLTKDNNTGIHYKILTQTTSGADSIKYSDKVSIVYTLKTLDGKYTSADTIANHFTDYLGNLTADNLPKGLQLAIHDLMKYKGSMRLFIPSNLAYGVNGYGSGSITNVNSRIAGNQSLDYYVHVINDQDAYDDQVIRNFISVKGLTGYIKDPLGYYYRVNTQPTGTVGDIKEFSNISTTYTGYLLNDASFELTNQETAGTIVPYSLVEGVKDALIKHAAAGTNISLLIPSSLGFGTAAQSSIPANSVLKFEFNIIGVTQP